MIPEILADAAARMDAEASQRTRYRDAQLQSRIHNLSALMRALQEEMGAVVSADPGNMERRLIKRRERLLAHLDGTPAPSLQERNAEKFVAPSAVTPAKARAKAPTGKKTWWYVAAAVVAIALLFASGLLEPGSAGDFRNLRPSDW